MDNFKDQNNVVSFIDQNGVTVFVDQNGIILGVVSAPVIRKRYVHVKL